MDHKQTIITETELLKIIAAIAYQNGGEIIINRINFDAVSNWDKVEYRYDNDNRQIVIRIINESNSVIQNGYKLLRGKENENGRPCI